MIPETTLAPNPVYAKLATDEQIERAKAALEAHGMRVIVVENGAEARAKFHEIVPAGAEVFTSTSATTSQIGLKDEIDQPNGRYQSVRVKLGQLDAKTQNREMQKLGATPEYIVGSVHAVTETGSVVIASGSGSQLAPYAAAAANVVWMVGTQKIVPTLEAAFQRIEAYSLPLESERLMKIYGVPSSVSKLLIVNKELNPQRTTLIMIKDNLGF